MSDHISLKGAAKLVEKLTNGSLDYLIVNGVYADAELNWRSPSTFTGDEEALRKDMMSSLDVNVLGAIYSINAFLPLIRKSPIKKVVAISTGLADMDNAPKSEVSNFVTYTSMKAALNMVIARYSVELKDEGIIFLALSPGIVHTKEEPRMYNGF
jgi:NAD(P)-dependent dehydrogenase (short-subunit alcohol dehydrogenase family)